MNQLIQLLQDLHPNAREELKDLIMPNDSYWLKLFACSMADMLDD